MCGDSKIDIMFMKFVTIILGFTLSSMLELNVCYSQVRATRIEAKSHYDNGTLYLSLTNMSSDTIYIFSSYLDESKSRLRYLYRINHNLT